VALLKALLLALFCTATFAIANPSAKHIADLYQKGEWPSFFAQSYLMRTNIKEAMVHKQKIPIFAISSTVLETLAYIRHCQFDTAAQILRALDLIVADQESTPELTLIKNDLKYLHGLLDVRGNVAGVARLSDRAQNNATPKTKLKEEEYKDLWAIPSGQKARALSQKNISPYLVAPVKNICRRKELHADL
jgi:hypothetical protein